MYKSTPEQIGVEITHPHNDQYLPCHCTLTPNLYDFVEKLCEPSKKGHLALAAQISVKDDRR